MYTIDEIQHALTGHGLVTQEAFAKACNYAVRHRLNIDESLITLGVADFTQLGDALSQLYELPYRPLSDLSVPPEAWQAISPVCARHWGIYPIDVDPEYHTLTIAVPTPQVAAFVEKALSILTAPYTLAFCIAAKAEIDAALANAPKNALPDPPAPSAEPTAPVARRPVPYGPRAPAPAQTSDISEDEMSTMRLKMKRSRRASIKGRSNNYALPSEDLQKKLIDIARAVSEELAEKPRRLERVREHVRYSQLLSARLAIDPVNIQRTILAAWLSAYGKDYSKAEEFGNPAGVLSVLKPPPAHKMPKIDQRVLSLIDQYLSVASESPETCRNLNVMQSILRPAAMAGDEGQLVLGTFMELLRDERFLSKGRPGKGAILIVDGAEFAAPVWSPAFARNGFAVESVSTLTDARRKIKLALPDLIVIGANHPDGDGIELCRELSRKPGCPAIACVLPLNPPPEAPEFIAAGADQTWTQDIAVNVLPERAEQLINSRQHAAIPEGLQGDLSQLNLVDMIQILSAAEQNMRISLRRAGREGHVHMQAGELICAELGNEKGQDALFELLSWTDGEFSAAACKGFPPTNLSGDTLGLLMEAARVADEALATVQSNE